MLLVEYGDELLEKKLHDGKDEMSLNGLGYHELM